MNVTKSNIFMKIAHTHTTTSSGGVLSFSGALNLVVLVVVNYVDDFFKTIALKAI